MNKFLEKLPNFEHYCLCYVISGILYIFTIFILYYCKLEIIQNILLYSNVVLYCTYLGLCIYCYNKINHLIENYNYSISQKQTDEVLYKEYIKQINDIFYKLYPADLRENIIAFIKNNEFDNTGILNYTISLNKKMNKNDKILFVLNGWSQNLRYDKKYQINDKPLFYTEQKECTNEYLVFINTEIIKLIKK